MYEAGYPGRPHVFMVATGQAAGEASDADAVCEAVILPDVRSNAARERGEVQRPPSTCATSSDSSMESRLRYSSPRKLPAHMTTAFSPLSL